METKKKANTILGMDAEELREKIRKLLERVPVLGDAVRGLNESRKRVEGKPSRPLLTDEGEE